MKPIRIAHLSDLHFGCLSLSPLQFFSKRWIGNLNLLFQRNKQFQPQKLKDFGNYLHSQEVSGVIITGDLTTTSTRKEYTLAKNWIESLRQKGLWVMTLPGNHDHYTKKAYRQKRYYRYFDNGNSLPKWGKYSLEKDGMEVYLLGDFWLVVLDTTLATPWFSASGVFSSSLEKKLEHFLEQEAGEKRVILCNHFPLFDNGNKRNQLFRREAFQTLLKRFPQVCLYLHGHNHRSCIADLRPSLLPIILDSGSISYQDRSSFHILTLSSDECKIEAFAKNNKKPYWHSISTFNSPFHLCPAS